MNDLRERDQALDTTQSFIVQAPAGSGKTTLLTSRFIRLLETVDQPEEILAMTFTRKATAEMRERILEVLDPDSGKKLPQESANEAVERVRRRSAELGWNLHLQPSRLQIMTFDALATALIRCMPWSSRFGSVPGIVQDQDSVYAAAAANTIESADSGNDELCDAIKVLHAQLDNNSDRLQELIVSMLSSRDQWLRILFSNAFTDDDKLKMEDSWRMLIKSELDEIRALFPQNARQILELDSLDNSQPSALEYWREVADTLLTKAGKWRSMTPKTALLLSIGKESFKEVVRGCILVPKLDEKLRRIGASAPDPIYDERQWAVLRAASVILQQAVAQLKLEFRKRGEVDYIEIAQRASEALGSAESPTDLALILDYRYRHILVDEFQDSSFNQHNLLKSLTSGWQEDDGRTIFLVGDPMQSIYRFREAEVGIYLSVAERGLGNLHPIPLRLNQNFRSSAGLVDWFNDVFKHAFPEDDDVVSSRVSYSPCVSDIQTSAAEPVHIWLQNTRTEDGSGSLLAEEQKSAEALKVVRDIRAYLDRNAGLDVTVAVLVRGRSHVAHLLPMLDQEQIRYYAAEIFPLSERPVVQDILSLARALLNFADRTSWLAILRAPWCGLTLDDLLLIGGDAHATIWSRLNQADVIESLSDDGRHRVDRVVQVLRDALSIRGRLAIRQWIEDTWVLLGGPACVGRSDDENAKLFLDFLEGYARGGEVEHLDDFEKQMKSLFAVPECTPDQASVHVMTMHSAKGLEFDAVFIPGFNRRPNRSTSPLLAWSEVLLKDSGAQLLISPIHDTGSTESDPKFKFLNDWNTQKNLMEITRLAYVACTRAKQELHIYGAISHDVQDMEIATQPGKSILLGALWPGLAGSDFRYVLWSSAKYGLDRLSPPAAQEFTGPIISRLPGDWQLPPPPAPLSLPDRTPESPGDQHSIDFDWAGSVAVWIGTIVHRWLNRIVQSGSDTWDESRLKNERPKWRTALLSMGMSSDGDELDVAVKSIEKALMNVFSDPTGRWLLDTRHTDAQAEFRLTGHFNGQFRNVILDRTFVDEHDVRWIVDYKTGTTGGNVENFLENETQRYREQLMGYRQVVSGFERRPIRLGLYFPMFPAWREVE